METEVITNPAYALRSRLHTLRRRREKLDREINDLVEQMHVACTHDDVRIEDGYVEGSYYDRCQYLKIHICNICGKEVKRDVTYGGYG